MAINTGVNVSKLVGYAVLGIPGGVNVTKLIGYAVAQYMPGVNVSKVNVYGAIWPNQGVSVSKANTYAALWQASAPAWPSFDFAEGTVSVAYSVTFDLTPSFSPTTYSVASGSLPPGLSVSSISGDIGQLAGTPTTAGTYTFVLRATNTYGVSDKSFTMLIYPVPTIGSSSNRAWVSY